MAEYDFIVLGAGVAGLAFAKRVSEHGRTVLILEKEKEVGGLSRTLLHNGFHLDFCAHRFHTMLSVLEISHAGESVRAAPNPSID